MKQQLWPHERAGTDLPLDQLLDQAVPRFPRLVHDSKQLAG
jgi:hypothetical protein